VSQNTDGDLLGHVRELTKLILLIEGDLTGPLLRDIAAALVRRLPGAQLATLRNCAHLAPVLRPVAIADEIRNFAL
jgi:pimeloyl-ACP methyl ester carboxylesterase